MKAMVFLLALFCGQAVAAEGSSIKIDVGAAMHLTKTKQMDPVGVVVDCPDLSPLSFKGQGRNG